MYAQSTVAVTQIAANDYASFAAKTTITDKSNMQAGNNEYVKVRLREDRRYLYQKYLSPNRLDHHPAAGR